MVSRADNAWQGIGAMSSVVRSRTGEETKLEVLHFLRDYVNHHGYAPSLREIGDRVGMSRANAFLVLRALHERGLIRLMHKIPRGIVVPRRCPHCGVESWPEGVDAGT